MALEPVQIPSIFLPRVSFHHDENFVGNKFWEFLGCQRCPIHHIDMVEKTDNRTGKPFLIAFIFFNPLERHEIPDWVCNFAADIEAGKRLKLIHTHPRYWNMSKNTGTRRSPVLDRPRVLSEADEADIKAAQKEILAKRAEQREVAPVASNSGGDAVQMLPSGGFVVSGEE